MSCRVNVSVGEAIRFLDRSVFVRVSMEALEAGDFICVEQAVNSSGGCDGCDIIENACSKLECSSVLRSDHSHVCFHRV